MRKILVLIILGLILSGCATYKFQKSTAAGSQGYLASYDGKPIVEYTAGKEKSLPDLTLAKERFKRRRATVEYYYKQMDLIESRLKEFFWDPPVMLLDLLSGVLRWPFVAVADYKYNRNPQYKAKVDRLDEQKEVLEKVRINSLKEKLAAYIAEDLNKEPLPQASVLPATPGVAPQAEILVPKEIVPQEITPPAAVVVEPPQEIKPVVIEPVIAKTETEPPVAIIEAKPMNGYSPLIVKFSGQKSYSKSEKIIAYDWSFGDGDTSTKKNPENTYWSTTFGPRTFTVTLTVRDTAGQTSVASMVIEVITK